MILNDTEYRETMLQLKADRKHIAQRRALLRRAGNTPAEIKRLLDPQISFSLNLKEELQEYARMRKGDFGELKNLRGLGNALIALRISRGITQRELAKRLKVDESQVSRDERNEYHGITVERASRVLDALGVSVKSKLRFGAERFPFKRAV